MSSDSQKYGCRDKQQPPSTTKTKPREIRRQSSLNAIWEESGQRNFNEGMKNPEHYQCEWEAQLCNALEGVSEPAIRRQVQEVFEIGRESSDDNS